MKKYPVREIKSLEILLSRKICNNYGKVNNYTQVQIIDYLLKNEEKDVYQKDFECILNIRKSTISGILDTMEKNNIIKRSSNGKGKIIKLTDESKIEHEKMIERLKMFNDKLQSNISEYKMKIFYEVLDIMKSNISGSDFDV